MASPMFYKPNILRRVLIGIAITLGVLLIIAGALFGIHYLSTKERNVPINNQPTVTSLDFELDSGISYNNAVTSTALFFYSTENLKIINPKGELVKDLSLKFSHPVVVTKGALALFYDRGGRKAVVFNGVKESTSVELEENILLASINESGTMLFVTESNLHKCAVCVYDSAGKELFKWNSGSLSVIAADISDNNKDVTVSAVNTDEGNVKNKIIMFNIAKEKPFTDDTYENNMFSVVRYSGGYLYCIGTKDTRIYNSYGKCIGTVAYNEREIQQYALDGDLLALVFSGSSDSSGVAEIKSFNQKGDCIGSFSVMQKFDYIDAKDGIIVLNNGRTISLLNSRCQEKRQINLNFDLRDFTFWGSGKKGIGITASGAEMIELH